MYVYKIYKPIPKHDWKEHIESINSIQNVNRHHQSSWFVLYINKWIILSIGRLNAKNSYTYKFYIIS